MTMFVLWLDGPIEIPEDTTASCPDCGGGSTNLVEHHKMSCSTRRCPKCFVWVQTGHGHQCQKSEDPPRPTVLFPIPARPRNNRWRVEWRWKPKVFTAMVKDAVTKLTAESPYSNVPSMYNDWTEHTGDGALRTERIARNRVVVLRRNFPGKSWRVRGYRDN